MTTVRDFNSTVFDLVHELTVILPGIKEIALVKALTSTLVNNQPDTRLILDKFWVHAQSHGEIIRNGDSRAMLDALKVLVPKPDLVDRIWSRLSGENQEAVCSYVKLLLSQADEINSVSPPPPTPEGPQAQYLYTVYNNMWKEFIGHVRSHTTKEKAPLEDTVRRLEELLGVKGQDSDVIHKLLIDSMAPILPDVENLNEHTLMQYMLPATDPVDTVVKDMSAIGHLKFTLSSELYMRDVLGSILESDDPNPSATYWHYLKLLTLTLRQCPPELLEIMGNLSRTLMESMKKDGST